MGLKIHFKRGENVSLCGENSRQELTADPLGVTCQWCLRSLLVLLDARLKEERKESEGRAAKRTDGGQRVVAAVSEVCE